MTSDPGVRVRTPAPALGWMVVAALAAAALLLTAFAAGAPAADRLAAGTWLASVLGGLFLAAPRPTAPRLAALRASIAASRVEIGLVGTIAAGALLARTVWLETHPYPWMGDEASIARQGLRILDGSLTRMFETSWASQPNWSFATAAAAQWLTGGGIVSLRLVSAIAGTLAVVCTYLAARDLFDRRVATVAAVVLATLPHHLHFSRVGVHNVMDSLMAPLVCWVLARACRTGRPRTFYAAGVLAGLCVYTYAGTRLVTLLACASVAAWLVRDRPPWRARLRAAGAFAAALVLITAPLGLFFARHPGRVMGRLGEEGILFNGWLAREAAITGQSVWELLANQVTKTVLVYVSHPAAGNVFQSPRPYLGLLAAALFLIGMALAAARVRRVENLVVLAWFWSVVLLGGVLTLNPPAHTRLLMACPPLAMLIGLAVTRLTAAVDTVRALPRQAGLALTAVALAWITWQQGTFYLVEYRQQMYFQDPNSEFAQEAGLLARTFPAGSRVFVMGAPRVFTSFPTLPYLLAGYDLADLDAARLAALDLPADADAAFVATPENHRLLNQARARFPGGTTGLVYRKPRPDDVLFEYYVLARE